MKGIKYIFVALFFIIICAEQVLNFTSDIKTKELSGAFNKAKKPSFSLATWFNNSFQDSMMNYYEQNLKLHNLYVRINNQINFTLFKQISAKSVLLGKNNQLYEDYYIDSYLGKDYLGEDTINKRVADLAMIQKALEDKNITLLTLISPSKPSIYPEDMPQEYVGLQQKKISNYDAYVKAFKANNINLIDYRNYFLLLKKDATYPLFSNLGTHWNGYGVTLAADTLIKYIENKRKIEMVDCMIDKGIISDTAWYYDHDLMKLMNLCVDLPGNPLYYPKVSFMNEQSRNKPNVLLIGDSYSLALIYTYPFFQHLFGPESEFWYYNTTILHVNANTSPISNYVVDQNLYEKIARKDVVILLFNEHNLKFFDFNFTKRMNSVLQTWPENKPN